MSEKSSNRDMSWERQAGEPDKWYQRFLVYLRQPPTSRSLAAAVRSIRQQEATPNDFKKSKKVGQYWAKMARRWDWEGRARRYDDYQQQEIERGEIAWRLEMRKSQQDLASKMMKQAHQMVDVPIVRQERIERQDGTTVIIRPTKRWSKETVTAYAATASRLADGIDEKDQKKKLEAAEKDNKPQFDIDWLREVDPTAAKEETKPD